MKNTQAQRDRRALRAARNATKRQRDERARRAATGIALIERPLRFIDAKTGTHVTGKDGRIRSVQSDEYKLARQYAGSGCGLAVKQIARDVLAATLRG